jgi:phosphate transport system substrate-binding protein
MSIRLRVRIGKGWVVLFLLLLAGCGHPSGRLVVAGSTTAMYPVGILAEAYERRGGQRWAIQGVGSTAGLLALERGQAALAMTSRALTTEEKAKGMREIPIGYDLLVVVVHPSNPIESLTREQLRALWERWVTDWREVGGRPGTALPHGREYGSGAEAIWSEVIATDNYGLPIAPSSGFLRQEAINDPRAITYISLRHYRLGGLKALKVDGIAHTDSRYLLRHPIFLVAGPKSPPEVLAFVAFAQSPTGQRLIAEEGLIPLGEGSGVHTETAPARTGGGDTPGRYGLGGCGPCLVYGAGLFLGGRSGLPAFWARLVAAR